MENREFYIKIEQIQIITNDFDEIMTNNLINIDEKKRKNTGFKQKRGLDIYQSLCYTSVVNVL